VAECHIALSQMPSQRSYFGGSWVNTAAQQKVCRPLDSDLREYE